jgi:hypothetical protein
MPALWDGRFACGKCGRLAIPSDENFQVCLPEMLRAAGARFPRCG